MIKALLFDFSGVLIEDKHTPPFHNPSFYDQLNADPQVFNFYFAFNEPLLTFLETTRIQRPLYIYSNSDRLLHSQPVLPRIQKIFTDIFSSKRTGWSKTDPDSYITLASTINQHPNEILFIDDSQWNLEAAQAAGMNTIYFDQTQSVIDHIQSQLK